MLQKILLVDVQRFCCKVDKSRNFFMKRLILCAGFLAMASTAYGQETPKKTEKERQLEGVTITKTKKAVEQKPDRTIFDFSEQPQLNSGTALEGIKKLPGLVATDIAGMMYQGKLLEVYMDGRPLNITTNELNSFLEGMPANAIERIEIVTQPGAEFPATSGGAILNIITSKAAKNYLTATYSGNYSFSNYEKWRNQTNNSINLNARNKVFGWQLSVGQNYRESMMNSDLDRFSFTNSDRTGRGYFTKAAVTFDLGMDRLLLNYDLYHNNNDNTTASGLYSVPGMRYDLGDTENWRHEAVVTYQKRFTDLDKKLDFKLSDSNSDNAFTQNNLNVGLQELNNNSNMNVATFKVDYSQSIDLLDQGKISAGGLYEKMDFSTKSFGIKNLDYNRQTASMYAELQAKLKKFDFILGTRAEDYDISGTYLHNEGGSSETRSLLPFKQFKLFPNASVQYNIRPQLYFALNYNKKITLPSISAINPNNNTYQNANTSITGNPNLRPTIYDNFEAKLSAFDYAFIGYNVSVLKDQVAQRISRNGVQIRNQQVNIPDMKLHNFNVGLPIPMMIFTKPLSEIMKFNFNPDKINFVYLYAGWQKHEIPTIETRGFWMFNVMSQIILPKDIKFNANYFYLHPKGNYYYFVAEKPIGNSVDITISKKFMADRLNVSVFAKDIFNGQQMSFSSADTPKIYLGNKYDSRSFGLSVNYKIPTKNRLAREDPNLLNREKKEENGGLIQTQ